MESKVMEQATAVNEEQQELRICKRCGATDNLVHSLYGVTFECATLFCQNRAAPVVDLDAARQSLAWAEWSRRAS